MTNYAALLRGINVGGNKKVAMADLRDLATALKLSDARTLLQSGNLVFGSKTKSTTAQLERLLEKATLERCEVDTKFFVRTAAEWGKTIASNPFVDEAANEPARLLVLFCHDAPAAAAVKALQARIVGRERVRAVGREAFIVYPDGMGTSKLTLPIIERGLGTSGTGRNWNTVMKISASLAG